jgi:hypothetical protein
MLVKTNNYLWAFSLNSICKVNTKIFLWVNVILNVVMI